jgi:hypothetical protein
VQRAHLADGQQQLDLVARLVQHMRQDAVQQQSMVPMTSCDSKASALVGLQE